ncbi:MAG: DUF1573 domain-containing protein [Saprospiraceae bacterium]
MKRIAFFLSLALVLSFSLSAQVTTPTNQAATLVDPNYPQMVFEDTTVDYGTIEQGADPYRVFAFTNTGNAPLVITNAKGSCGCTVPTYPKEPIAPWCYR